MVYQWKTAACIKADAQAAGEQFEMLERTVGLTAENVLEANRAEGTPLHDEFEWCDNIAAEKYRLAQAGHFIRALCVKSESTNNTPIRGFLKTTYSSPYKSVEIIVENMDEYAAMLNRAKNELRAFADKYSTLSELDTVIEAINSVIGETE